MTHGPDPWRGVDWDGLRRQRSDYRELLDWLESWHRALDGEFAQTRLPDHALNGLEAGRRKGFPLFLSENLPYDLEQVCRVIRACAGGSIPDRSTLYELAVFLTADKNRLREIIRYMLSGDMECMTDLIRDADPDLGLTVFLIHFALKPSFWALRQSVAALVSPDFRDGCCPLCGSPPKMGRLEKDGRRRLSCSLCGQEWLFDRLGCPYCGTNDQNALYYLYSEGEEGYRISACNRCHGYLKTVDSRSIETPLPLDLEDLLTMHLDMLANEKGLTTAL